MTHRQTDEGPQHIQQNCWQCSNQDVIPYKTGLHNTGLVQFNRETSTFVGYDYVKA